MSSASAVPPTDGGFSRKVLRVVAITLFIAAFTALLIESAYRFYLHALVAEEVAKRTSAFKPAERPSFGAAGVAPWQFDRDVGHRFYDGAWRTGIIVHGAFNSCTSAGEGNRLGNVGWLPDNYATADLRLMIVGSSFSMVPDVNGKLIEQVLSERLQKRLNRSVSVLNYSRDSTGLLAYMDMARFKYEESKPHAILALINAPALFYRRHWRVVVPEQDGFHRLYFSLDRVTDTAGFKPGRAVPQNFVVSDGVTEDWCRTMTSAHARGDEKTLREDPLVQALVARYNQLQKDMVVPKIAIDFWRLDVSFAWNLISAGNAFEGMVMFADQPVYTPLDLTRFSDDPDFGDTIAVLKGRGVPVIPVHLATLPEMRNDPEGRFEFATANVPPRQGASLAADLEAALGEPFVHLYRYYPPELKGDPLKLVQAENDWHPNSRGVHAMAEALERMLAEHPRTAPLLKRQD
jgi:hypothetical protein